MTRYIIRANQLLFFIVVASISGAYTKLKFLLFEIRFGPGLKSNGVPRLELSLKSSFIIGKNLSLNNGRYYNTIGRQQKCCFSVGNHAVLKIGNHVGISCTTIVCKKKIEIEDHVHIGGNCEIYDTDFHDLNFRRRTFLPEDFSNIQPKPILIKKYAFIGAHTTILKGVVIGQGAVIGACSVVTKNIPPFEVWAGNPIKFIAKLTPGIPCYSNSEETYL
jgi:acetyltransferase-like isoleucine patch superfamily enzyme